MTLPAFEVNFDSIVGPTHNYAGLARGNLASHQNRNLVSNPRDAALEGLAKMKRVMDLGVRQAVLPPHDRPDVAALRRLGFAGTDAAVIAAAARHDPFLLNACSSASAMWAANAATVSAGADTADRRVHFTTANLCSHLHRCLEAATTADILRAIFSDESHFAHHPALPAAPQTADEGAANHTRLCARHGEPGIELFTYGRDADGAGDDGPRFTPRQSRQASQSIARLHQLDASSVLFLQQHPDAISAGAFHNDVVAVGHQNVFIFHEHAYAHFPAAMDNIAARFKAVCGGPLHMVAVPANVLPLDDAVKCYLFNSQILSHPDGSMVLLAPEDCRHSTQACRAIDLILAAGTPIDSVEYVDVRQSMRNGGGPACLRLRVVLNHAQWMACHQGVLLTDGLYGELCAWVRRHYRAQLSPADLADAALLDESRRALDALTRILKLGSLYAFQRQGAGPSPSVP